MKKLFPFVLILILLLTSCSFPEKIADIPKAEDVGMIRIAFFGHDLTDARRKEFTDPEDIREILFLLRKVELQYESTGTRYGGTSCTITCCKPDGIAQEFCFSGTFDAYAIWANDDTVYYTVLSGGKALSDFYENADVTETYRLPTRS